MVVFCVRKYVRLNTEIEGIILTRNKYLLKKCWYDASSMMRLPLIYLLPDRHFNRQENIENIESSENVENRHLPTF